MDYYSVFVVSLMYYEMYVIVGDKCFFRDISVRVMKICFIFIFKKCEVVNVVNKCLLNIGFEVDKR